MSADQPRPPSAAGVSRQASAPAPGAGSADATSPGPRSPAPANDALKVHVPGNHLMTGLLGQRDAHLRLIEAAFPSTRISVRGNEFSVAGPDAPVVAGCSRSS